MNPSEDGEPCCECASCAAVSAGEHMDVMEIDSASNRGIDQIRDLKSHVGLASFMGGAKVYILDEVHMLTMEAFNALLKTLEEPPPSVMFIFATTEPHKVPATIRSRCQHIPFHRISTERMVERLRRIADAEGVLAEDSALWEISRNADGALRDAISLFEQAMAISGGEISAASVRSLFGGGSRVEMERWATLLRERPEEAYASLKTTLDLGISPERFLDSLFPLLRDMWTYSLWGEKSFAGTSLSDEEKNFLREEAPNWKRDALKRAAMACASLFPRARFGLGNDVFSGLLLFEMLNALESPAVLPAATAKPAAQAGGPPKPASSVSEANLAGLNEIMANLARDDLPLAAAILDVRMFREGDLLKPDFAEATKAAEITLSSARAGVALKAVFGIALDAPRDESGGSGANGDFHAAPAGVYSSAAISARLGADILMSKRLDSEDAETETGDMEDEQF
jgi:DNA polymerase-3 subunit gamma/tau